VEELNPNKVGIAVRCQICDRRKAPVGRSVAAEMANSLCGPMGCKGYYLKPLSGSLWPGESEADFGYPVADTGTVVNNTPSGKD
jgi:hypothetical protein